MGIIVLFYVLADQITKFLITSFFAEGEGISLIPNFLHVTYVKNRGIAFGLLQGKGYIVVLITTIAIILILIHLIKEKGKQSFWERNGFLLILAGAIGNLIDRIFRGFVVDMIDFRGIWSYVFNVADVWINIGVGLLIVDYFWSLLFQKSSTKK